MKKMQSQLELFINGRLGNVRSLDIEKTKL